MHKIGHILLRTEKEFYFYKKSFSVRGTGDAVWKCNKSLQALVEQNQKACLRDVGKWAIAHTDRQTETANPKHKQRKII